jgi:FMN phosphatase YigB (HAD superfamily)
METRIVCFDIGGVLVRIVKTWGEALVGVGLPSGGAPEGPFHRFDALDPYQEGAIGLEGYLDRLRSHLGLDTSEEALRAHNGILIEEYPGVLDVVMGLKAGGIFTACLSNTNEPHFEELVSSGRFPAIEALDLQMASHAIGANKPDAAIYEAFEVAAGASGREIAFFDDSQTNVDAAMDRGWRATRIDPEAGPAKQMRAALDLLEIRV